MAIAAECAAHLFMSLNRFNELLNQNIFARAARNGYDLDDVREKYILYQRKVASGRLEKAPGASDLNAERAKLVEAQTETAAFKLAVSQGKYVLKSEMLQKVSMIFNTVRERVLGRVGKSADKLANRDLAAVTLILHDDAIETLNELSDPNTFTFGFDVDDSDASGDDIVQAAAESVADPVG